MGPDLDATQQRLLGILYRFDCPSTLAIGEYVMGLSQEPERSELAQHVLECGPCAAELSTSRVFLATDVTLAGSPDSAAECAGSANFHAGWSPAVSAGAA